MNGYHGHGHHAMNLGSPMVASATTPFGGASNGLGAAMAANGVGGPSAVGGANNAPGAGSAGAGSINISAH